MPEHQIDIANRAPRPHPYAVRDLRRLAAWLLDRLLPQTSTELSLSLLGDRRMRQLNRDHRGKDKSTDVLSFPQEPDLREVVEGTRPAPSELVLGDVCISPRIALQQAADWGWTPEERMAQLVIHGVLHLLGYDHEEAADREVMEAIEERLFEEAAAAGVIANRTA